MSYVDRNGREKCPYRGNCSGERWEEYVQGKMFYAGYTQLKTFLFNLAFDPF